LTRGLRTRLRAIPLAAGACLAALLSLANVGPASAASTADSEHNRTAVYTISNATGPQGGNSVLAYRDTAGGSLRPFGTYSTGGDGTGTPLGSQGAVTLAGDSRLVAVNAGSNTVSAFDIGPGGRPGDPSTASSGGKDPISVTAHGWLVYVLNAGDNTVSGLRIGEDGLSAIEGSTRALSSGAQSPEQVSFTPDGRHLIVTEKASNTIDVFQVRGDGLLGAKQTTSSLGQGPYGFDFDRFGRAIVSDAADSALTSYNVGARGRLHAIGEVPDGQKAACWTVVDPRTGHAYVANAASGTISFYQVDGAGQLSLRSAASASPGGHPVDEALGGQGHEFFVLLSPGGKIMKSTVTATGDLGPIGAVVTGLPNSATGLAVSSDQ
jgi:6-phosphogluconolactonase (cycloisomerase 2 family)